MKRQIITMKAMPKEERPRERLMKHGAAELTNSELLAILIGTGSQDKTALTLATDILSLEKTGVAHLADCMPEELCFVKGIGMAKSCQIIAAIELGRRISVSPKGEKICVSDPEFLASLFMEELRYLKKEIVKILLLNVKSEIIMEEEIAVGILNRSLVHPREVFHHAVRKCAASLILVHNHPSGDPTPSQGDLDVTMRLLAAGDILGIPLQDHLIIGDGVFVSLKQEMLMFESQIQE